MEQGKIIDDNLAESIQIIKNEVKGLQIAAVEQKTPWYKNLATWIAIFALFLSFGTAYFSYTRAKAQDIQGTRAELRGLLQRLVALPTEYYEAINKYPHDSNVLYVLQERTMNETALLSAQAAELAKKLPRENVSAT